ncbi:MAG: hypothetical protein ABL903_12980 [Methylococcales bacterium]
MAKITQLSQLDLYQPYRYADYLTLQIDQAIKLIKGKIMLMSLAPNVEDQRITSQFPITIGWHLKDERCELFPAPFDVRLYNRKSSCYPAKTYTHSTA